MQQAAAMSLASQLGIAERRTMPVALTVVRNTAELGGIAFFGMCERKIQGDWKRRVIQRKSMVCGQ